MPQYDGAGHWLPATPATIPLLASTSGTAQAAFEIDHLISNASFPAPSSSFGAYAPQILRVNYTADTANIQSPSNLTCVGAAVVTTYGSPTISPRGTVQSQTILFDIQGSGDPGNEFAALMGWMRAGTTTRAPVGRQWFADWTNHGPIGAQAGLLNGVTMCLQKYHNSVPLGGPAAAFIGITRPGAGAGSENGQVNAQTYALEAMFAGVGYAGVPGGGHTRGAHACYTVGGAASGWMLTTETSIFGRGLDVTDVEEAGVKLWGPLSSSGMSPKGIWFGDDPVGRTWNWLLYADDSTGHMHTPTSGALLLPGANGTGGQIQWGVDALAPRFYRQADSTLQVSGKLRVVGSGITDPALYLSAGGAAVSQIVDAGTGILKLGAAGGAGNFLTGSAAGDALILATSGKRLLFGNDANQAWGAVRDGPQWGFGTLAPTDGLHAAVLARFNGAVVGGSIPETNAGVYLGLEANPKAILVTGTAGQRKWQIENAAGVLTFSEPGAAHWQLSNTTLTLPSKVLAQQGAGTNTFAGGIQVDGATRLATTLGGLLKATAGLVSAAAAGTDYEAALGNPSTNGQVLSSLTNGTRSWITPAAAGDLTNYLDVRGAGGAIRTVNFASAPSGDALLSSTSDAAKGSFFLGTSEINEATNCWGINTFDPLYNLDVLGTIRFQSLANGVLQVDANGVVSVGTGGGVGAGWARDAVLGLLYPATLADKLTLGGNAAISRLAVPQDPDFSAAHALVSLGAGAWDGVATGHFMGNASGTVLGVNASSAFGGNLADLQVGGASKLTVGATGQVTLADVLKSVAAGAVLDVPVNTTAVGATASANVIPIAVNGVVKYLRLYDPSSGGSGTLPQDDFNRANSPSDLGTSSSGHDWTNQMAHWGVVTNHAAPNAESNGYTFRMATLGGQTAIGTFRATFQTLIDTLAVMFRWSFDGTGTGSNTDAGCTGFVIQYSQANGIYQVLYWPGHTPFTALHNPSGVTPASGDIIEWTLASASPKLTVRVSQNGGSSFTTIFTSTSGEDSGVLANNATSANHGIGVQNVANYSTAGIDSYQQTA